MNREIAFMAIDGRELTFQIALRNWDQAAGLTGEGTTYLI